MSHCIHYGQQWKKGQWRQLALFPFRILTSLHYSLIGRQMPGHSQEVDILHRKDTSLRVMWAFRMWMLQNCTNMEFTSHIWQTEIQFLNLQATLQGSIDTGGLVAHAGHTERPFPQRWEDTACIALTGNEGPTLQVSWASYDQLPYPSIKEKKISVVTTHSIKIFTSKLLG